ncbi:putative membrane protein YqjE [Streptacidiphilus sp. MAP12-33]|uniref:DUF7544 domain-containing protein n=1 Tax=Streptacidiphilus sp. MAP12-33 TaxID=3156266 RepID=UPI003511EB70
MAPKPGVIPLRPLDIGEIINAVFATIRYNFTAVYGLPLVTGLGCVLLFVIFGAVEWSPLHAFYIDIHNHVGDTGWTPSGSEITNVLFALAGLVLLAFVTYEATYIAATLSSVATLRHAVVGRRVRFRQIASESTPYIWRLIGAMLLMQLICAGPMLLVVGIIVLLAFAVSGSGAAAAVGLLGFVFCLAAVVWAIYASIQLTPLSATVVLEGKNPVEAVKRAWQLNQGSWGRALGVTFLSGLIGLGIGYAVNQILSIFYVGALGLSGTTGSVDTSDPAAAKHMLITELVIVAVTMPVGMLVNLLTLPLTPLAQALHYIDRRIRRESLDIHLAEEAGIPFGGVTPPPPFDTPPPPATA